MKLSHAPRRFFGTEKITKKKEEESSIEIEMLSNSVGWHAANEGWKAFGRSLQTARHLYTMVFNACSADEQRFTHTHKKSKMNIF